MMGQPDTSWSTLERIAARWSDRKLVEARPLAGGSINQTLLLRTDDGAKAVLKLRSHRVSEQYVREARQLRAIAELGLPTPRVLVEHVADLDDPDSYLLLEYCEGIPLSAARQQTDEDTFNALQTHLAQTVATLHACSDSTYHRLGDDQAPRFEHWSSFFRHVYDPIIQNVEQSGLLPKKAMKLVHKVHDRLDVLLAHSDKPRMIHGDLWSTNILVSQDDHGSWRVAALIDPDCKFAHAEMEIAYLDLFQTATQPFRKAYQQHFKLCEDYHRVRKPVYQLYPMLNHVQLFGVEYLKPLQSAIERITPLV